MWHFLHKYARPIPILFLIGLVVALNFSPASSWTFSIAILTFSIGIAIIFTIHGNWETLQQAQDRRRAMAQQESSLSATPSSTCSVSRSRWALPSGWDVGLAAMPGKRWGWKPVKPGELLRASSPGWGLVLRGRCLPVAFGEEQVSRCGFSEKTCACRSSLALSSILSDSSHSLFKRIIQPYPMPADGDHVLVRGVIGSQFIAQTTDEGIEGLVGNAH